MTKESTVQAELVRALSAPSADGAFGEVFEFISFSHYKLQASRLLCRLRRSQEDKEKFDQELLENLNGRGSTGYPERHFTNFRMQRMLSHVDAPKLEDVDQFFAGLVSQSICSSHKISSGSSRIFIDDRTYIEGSEICEILNSGGVISLVSKNGKRFPLQENQANSVKVGASKGVEEIPIVHDDHGRFRLVSEHHVPAECLSSIDHEILSDKAQVREDVTTGLRTLSTMSSDYYDWCALASPFIVPVKSQNGAMLSGSQQNYPGLVYISGDVSPLRICEMLVHEASHQYFHALEKLGALKNPTSTELHYSPVVNTERPSDKLLLAYHAFMNVLIFMSQVDRDVLSEADQTFFIRNIKAVKNDLEGLAKGLHAASDLTDLGGVLWNIMQEKADEILIQ